MINILNKADCCGCSACVQKCPKQCISQQEDTEGFLYPVVDKEICIDCGLCEKVCPVINPYKKRASVHTYAAINKNEEVRMKSSSGGIFTLLAEMVIDQGGVVFGARFDENWQVIIDYTETKEGIAAFRESKYVQARTDETFRKCELFLKDKRKVLYSGTPCQIAGLKHFLRKEYDNLLTVDFVCHGVPSPKVWKLYLNEFTKPAFINAISKNYPFVKNGLYYLEKKDKVGKSILLIYSPRQYNPYMTAFLKDLILRPSCHSCMVKESRSMSDITIADFWGINDLKPEMFDNKGTSLILVNNHKINHCLLSLNMKLEEVPFEESIKYNVAFLKSSLPHKMRTEFWIRYNKGENLSNLVTLYVEPKGWRFFIKYIKVYLNKLISDDRSIKHSLKLVRKWDIARVSFREKNRGWKNYEFVVELIESTN